VVTRTVKNEREMEDKPGMAVSNAAAKAMLAKGRK
jgi:hypothetical protein